MARLALFPVLVVAACVIAGLYGALHNQISYTASPDYFQAFKFDQFGIPEDLRNRLGAAIVGWHASWWMGLVIGIPLLLIGLILPGWKAYLRHCLVAFGIVAVTTLAVGLAALGIACLTISQPSDFPFWIPERAADKVAFARAGTMHNFSYLGGLIGIVTGAIYLIIARIRVSPTR